MAAYDSIPTLHLPPLQVLRGSTFCTDADTLEGERKFRIYDATTPHFGRPPSLGRIPFFDDAPEHSQQYWKILRPIGVMIGHIRTHVVSATFSSPEHERLRGLDILLERRRLLAMDASITRQVAGLRDNPRSPSVIHSDSGSDGSPLVSDYALQTLQPDAQSPAPTDELPLALDYDENFFALPAPVPERDEREKESEEEKDTWRYGPHFTSNKMILISGGGIQVPLWVR